MYLKTPSLFIDLLFVLISHMTIEIHECPKLAFSTASLKLTVTLKSPRQGTAKLTLKVFLMRVLI